jgi:hypothetical protein
MLEEDRPADWDLFRQPSGLTPLTKTSRTGVYYGRLAGNPNRDWVPLSSAVWRRPQRDGSVPRGYKRSFHDGRAAGIVKGMPLLIGQDFGRNRAA